MQIAGHILNNMSKDYSAVVTSIEASGKIGDVEAIQEAVQKHWKKNNASGSKSKNLGETFVTEKFKGTCNYCKKPSHKFADCWKHQADLKKKGNNGDNDNSKKPVKCWICGGPHPKKQCPKYKGNKNNSNEMNHMFEEGMLLCTPIKKEEEPKVKELNLSVPVLSELKENSNNEDEGSVVIVQGINDATSTTNVDDQQNELIQNIER